MSVHVGERLLDGQRSTSLWLIGTTVALAASFGAGWMTFTHSKYALGVAVIAATAGLALVDPVVVSVMALPATLILVRGGGSSAGSNIAVADLMVVVGSLTVLPTIRWDTAPLLRRALLAAAVYELGLLVVVAFHPNRHDVLESAHRMFIISGGLIAGWAVARAGRASTMVKAFVVCSSCLGVAAAIWSALHGLKPAYLPFGFQKNAIGAYCWMALVTVQVNPRWVGLTRRMSTAARLSLVLGLIGSQSKQSVIALAVALVIAMVRHTGVRARSKGLLALLAPVTVAIYTVVAAQTKVARGSYNSAVIRLSADASDLVVWHRDIWVGQGPRWFYLPQWSGYIEPTNVLYEGLTDSGLLGVCTFVAMLLLLYRIVRVAPRDVATLAMALVAGRVVQGAFDSYWIGAQVAAPWLMTGAALGIADVLAGPREPSLNPLKAQVGRG